MDKEMMDKINEYLKANGKRELSMDELEKVAGGQNTVTVFGAEMDEASFNTMFINLAESAGYDYAKEVFHQATGFWCSEMRTDGMGIDGDVDRMNIVLNRFWSVYGDGAKH